MIYDVNGDGVSDYLDLIIDNNDDGDIDTDDYDATLEGYVTVFTADGNLVEEDTFLNDDGSFKTVGFLNDSSLFFGTESADDADLDEVTSNLYTSVFGDNDWLYEEFAELEIGDFMLATEGGDFYATADGATTDTDADGYADPLSAVFEEAPSDGLDVDITDLTAAVVGKEASSFSQMYLILMVIRCSQL